MSNYWLRKQNEKITVDSPQESEESLVDNSDDNPDYDPKNNKKPDSQICSMYVKMTMSLLLMTITRQVHPPQQKDKGKQTGTSSTSYKKKKVSMPVPVWTYVLEINSEQPLTAQLEPGVDHILGSPIDYFKDLFVSNILDVIVAESI